MTVAPDEHELIGFWTFMVQLLVHLDILIFFFLEVGSTLYLTIVQLGYGAPGEPGTFFWSILNVSDLFPAELLAHASVVVVNL